jgi:hypothetical protein
MSNTAGFSQSGGWFAAFDTLVVRINANVIDAIIECIE